MTSPLSATCLVQRHRVLNDKWKKEGGKRKQPNDTFTSTCLPPLAADPPHEKEKRGGGGPGIVTSITLAERESQEEGEKKKRKGAITNLFGTDTETERAEGEKGGKERDRPTALLLFPFGWIIAKKYRASR